jgi:hypothetical protein
MCKRNGGKATFPGAFCPFTSSLIHLTLFYQCLFYCTTRDTFFVALLHLNKPSRSQISKHALLDPNGTPLTPVSTKHTHIMSYGGGYGGGGRDGGRGYSNGYDYSNAGYGSYSNSTSQYASYGYGDSSPLHGKGITVVLSGHPPSAIFLFSILRAVAVRTPRRFACFCVSSTRSRTCCDNVEYPFRHTSPLYNIC